MSRATLLEWIASHVLPHEREVRRRLARLGSPAHEIDDVLQEAYLQLSRLDDVERIRDGRAYLLATARSVLLQRVRRDRIVRIGQLSDSEALRLPDDTPDPERRLAAKQELDRVLALIGTLPPRSRQVVHMRRVEGLSLRTIAERLGITEGSVEQEVARGLRRLFAALAAPDTAPLDPPAARRAWLGGFGKRRS